MKNEATPIAGPHATIRERLQKIWSVIDRALPYLLTAAYAVGLALVLSRHEMWRDETQAWLLARDAASPAELLHNMRYEGHPGLWHLLLWVPAQLTANPVAMQAVHWAIAVLAIFILLRCAPFRWPTRILIACGYFMSYEWAAISRNYAISLLLFFAFAALHRKRWRWFPAQAAVAFCLCHTNIHSIILVLVLLPTVAIEYAIAYAEKRNHAHKQLLPTCLGMGLIVLGLLTGIKQITPPDDGGFADQWHFTWQEQRAQFTATSMINAYAPVPVDHTNFWNSNQWVKAIPGDQYITVALWIAIATSLLFLCQPWPILPYLGGTLALLTFFYVKYPGSYRHHGFLFLLPIVLLWMSWDYRPLRLPWRWANGPSRIWHHLRELPLAALLLIHVHGSAIAIKHDWNETFSASKATADWIRAELPDWDQHLLAGINGAPVSAVVAHLQAPSIYYVDRNATGSYIVWDRQWHRRPRRTKDALTQRMRSEDKDLLLITTSRQRPHQLPTGTVLLHTISERAAVERTYHVYHCPRAANP
jgi:hypothetical protein